MKNKTKLIALSSIIFLGLSSFIIFKNMEDNKRYFLCITAGQPMEVTRRVKEDGWKVIGRFKMLKPAPFELTDDDLEEIRDSLSLWLENNYPDVKLDFKWISREDLRKKLKYEFTLLQYHGNLQGDFYPLKIGNDSVKHIVYISKAKRPDKTLRAVEYVIQFYNEEWHSNYDDPRPFNPATDLW